ncbi:acyl carrier protein [Massilia sp. TWP1-3-3]|uniref:acyl carrier protein n=1 Tax=Massilia sp. TWP1-3-3 TaxID=2804573 RepID=UPI003CEDB3A0
MKIDRQQFIDLIKQNVTGVSIDAVKPDDKLSDLGIDSLGFATLLFAIEDKLNVQIDDQYLSKLSGLSTIAELVSTFKGLGYEIEV